MDEAKLKRQLNELSELLERLISILFEKDGIEGEYNEILENYKQQRAEILLELTKDYKIPRISDPVLRGELQDFLKHGDKLISAAKKSTEPRIRNFAKVMAEQLRPEFDPDRLDDLASEHLYSWFSGTDYVIRMIETGTIVIKNIDFPEKLESLVNELRQCLIFERYFAAGIMLRTIVEVAVDDILNQKYQDEEFDTLEKKLDFLEGRSAFRRPASILNAFRKQMNEFVHGERLINKKYVKVHVDVVLENLEMMYEKF